MEKMGHLVEINLASNKINSLAMLGGLSSLCNLKSLVLSDNKIESLQDAERHLPSKLRHLDLSDNMVAELSEVSNVRILDFCSL